MDTAGFRTYLEKATYLKKGVETHYTENAISLRISRAQELENDLKINLDNFVVSKEKFLELLIEIRAAKIETLEHTPKSNAARHYFAYKNNGEKFGRIFDKITKFIREKQQSLSRQEASSGNVFNCTASEASGA